MGNKYAKDIGISRDHACFVFALGGLVDDVKCREIVNMFQEVGTSLSEDRAYRALNPKTRANTCVNRLAARAGFTVAAAGQYSVWGVWGSAQGTIGCPDHMWIRCGGVRYDKMPEGAVHREGSAGDMPACEDKKSSQIVGSVYVTEFKQSQRAVVASPDSDWKSCDCELCTN